MPHTKFTIILILINFFFNFSVSNFESNERKSPENNEERENYQLCHFLVKKLIIISVKGF
jgi:predicted RND superfamily exporter protein